MNAPDPEIQRIFSLLNTGNAPFLEELYRQYQDDPLNVEDSWRDIFNQLGTGAFYEENWQGERHTEKISYADFASKQAEVTRLIHSYRSRGHLGANINPLKLDTPIPTPHLDLDSYALTDADMHKTFNTGTFGRKKEDKLSNILKDLREIYTGSIGIEVAHITETEQLEWLYDKLENIPSIASFKPQEKVRILDRLTAAEGLERYLHTKYVGQKRFSLEGGDTLIPILSDIIQRSSSHGAKEIVVGMAHRGRLNVLVNILGKNPATLFSEFEGRYVNEPLISQGDVKYHMGFSSDLETDDGPVHLALAFNPSHLEIISPVVEGSVKARQQRRGLEGEERHSVMPVVIHGDAAFAGQGVVMETLQMASSRGYTTGGTVHIVVNNQIGFTTSNTQDARSTHYCTEIGKMVQTPIFHVNGDDPEAAVFISRIAMEFRQTFEKDVIIDLVCYRRHGHNEADEPAITQPKMYEYIRALPTTRELYANTLIEQQHIDASGAQKLVEEYRDNLDNGRIVAGQIIDPTKAARMIDWLPYVSAGWGDAFDTTLKQSHVKSIWKDLHTLPSDLVLHPRVQKLINDRNQMANGKTPMDWGFAEITAYAALLQDGFSVRLSGQDSGRGTFSHRHAILHNQNDRSVYVPLANMDDIDGRFVIINSLLSEEAVLGFEYGYSTTDPQTLVIWEAQFGDFANGAQVVIDQFISSGEEKWGRLSGLTMFLPHGYEGQGPEHSSARLERYLQLCAGHNMQVVIPSTPAQFFHMLRRQMVRNIRKPLVVMTPKSLLRNPLSVSNISDLSDRGFQNVIDEVTVLEKLGVTRIVLASGKVYFDLLKAREANGIIDTALVRVEQLQPFPNDELITVLKTYPNAKEVIWCQEEPQNQGAWYQLRHHFAAATETAGIDTLDFVARPTSASPAVGSLKEHQKEQKVITDKALRIQTKA